MHENIIVIMGPTASGKSEFGIALGKQFGGEIISGDALQVYKSLDIGTAKITAAETCGVPHHLIDIKEINEGYTVAEFCRLAKRLIAEIIARKRVPIIVGGTGLYIQALLEGYEFPDEGPLRKYYDFYEKIYEEKGLNELERLIRIQSPEYFESRPVVDKQRLIRALALLAVGKSYHATKKSNKPLFCGPVYALNPPREFLYKKINERVERMIADDLESEAKRLWEYPREIFLQSRKAIGYHEWEEFFFGDATRDEVIERIKRNTRRFAKRQITWLRRMKYVEWLNPLEFNSAEQMATHYLPEIIKKWEDCQNG